MRPLELWGGVECTVNRVGDHFLDQMEWSGHAARLDDLDRLAALGMTTIRQPVLWERLEPRQHGETNWDWADARLGRLRTLGLRPIVGLLHHGSGPSYTSLVDPRFPALLAGYARRVANRFPWVADWTPVNEPLTTARFSAMYGVWYPHARDIRSFVRALLNQLRGTALAMREIRGVNPAARLVQTEDLGCITGTPRLRHQIEHERHRRWLTWDLLSGRVDKRHPLYGFLRQGGAAAAELQAFVADPCPPDIIGVNYYVTSDRWLDVRLAAYPRSMHGGNGRIGYADVEAARARPAGIAGHERHLMTAWRRYGRPLALTEVHLGCTREEQMRWLAAAWTGAQAARVRGADVRAVTTWAAFGSHEWNSLVTTEAGYYEPGLFDVRGPAPRPTALARVARDLAGDRVPVHPVLRGEGWWRRPVRLTLGPAARAGGAHRAVSGPPVLIAGARGTLGRAFRRICEIRGVRSHLLTRADMDISDSSQIDAVIRRLKPWAVINAAGYVRVDAAEGDRESCWRDNVDGAVTLAAACRRHRLPLVTFSSDLVFDGSSRQPYREHDMPRPLNVYGATKAEAERRVLDLLPEALIVRTSAFFGPWDDFNFATVALRTLANGLVFRAPADSIVSPTYVPHLVDVVLDLLIDAERGIWHLANDGAVTWHEFARMVARASALSESLVQPCSWRDIWQPAPRPPYSVLASARGQLLPSLEAAVKIYADATAVTVLEASRCATS